jgi:hypothetical protein
VGHFAHDPLVAGA